VPILTHRATASAGVSAHNLPNTRDLSAAPKPMDHTLRLQLANRIHIVLPREIGQAWT
jgi:hypothetical protein